MTRSRERQSPPPDGDDVRLVTALAGLWRALDGVPDDLVDRIRLAVAREELWAELDALVRVPAAEVRGGDDHEVRTLTFTTPATTVLVQLSGTARGRRRLDGWVEPAVPARVELRLAGRTMESRVEDTGRFRYLDLPGGSMRLRLVPDDPGAASIVTPRFEW